MKLVYNNSRFEFLCSFSEKSVPKSAGFFWDSLSKIWFTNDIAIAKRLENYFEGDVSIFQDFKPVVLSKNTDGFFVCNCPYQYSSLPKKAGFWFYAKAKIWVTKDPEIAARLIEFSSSEELKSEIMVLLEQKNNNIKKSSADKSDIFVPSPEGLSYLPFQKASVEFSIGKKYVYIGDDMGLGKTIQAIAIYNYNTDIKTMLVVCPNNLKNNWRHELNKWVVSDSSVAKADAKSFPDSDIVIINYDIVEKFHDELRNREWDMVVFDEAHSLKNNKAKRTIFCLGGEYKKNEDESIMVDPIHATKKVVALSGTPLLNRPIEFWTFANYMDPSNFPSFMGYAKRYCGAKKGRFGWDYTGASNLEELQKKLRSSFFIRRLKKTVLPELPNKFRQVVEISACPSLVDKEKEVISPYLEKLEELYVALEVSKASSDISDYYEAVRNLKEGYSSAFDELAKIRHEIALSKIPYIVDDILETVDLGKKVICFTYHIDVTEKIVEKLREENISVEMYHGKMSLDSRNESVNRFQTDEECKVIVGTYKAMGVGLTLTESDFVLLAELDWVPAVISQAEDRSCRYGQKNSVLVRHIVVEGSLDSYMAYKIIEKQEIIDQALDGELPVCSIEPVTIDFSKFRSFEGGGSRDSKDVKKDVVFDAVTSISEKIAGNKEYYNVVFDAILQVAGNCDGADKRDDVGFNKIDASVARRMVSNGSLMDDRQVAYALLFIMKYKKQINADTYSTLVKLYNKAIEK